LEPLVHNPNEHREWNESFYFVFQDRENNVKGMTRLGLKPNKDEGMTFLLIFLPDGSVAGYRATEPIRGEWGSHEFEAAGMKFNPREDGSWRFTFKGTMVRVMTPTDFPKVRDHPELIAGMLPVEMDMTLKPFSPTYEYGENMTEESLEIGKSSGDEHWEQIGDVEGSLKVGETVYEVQNQIGQRDHTHGVRDWTGVGDWLYYVVWFSRDLAVNPAAIIMEDRRVSFGGFLYKDGRNIPIMGIRVVDQQFVNGIVPVSSTLELVDADGVTHVLKGRAGPTVPIPFIEGGKMSILSQGFGEFTLDGVEGGYGSYETLRVARRG